VVNGVKVWTVEGRSASTGWTDPLASRCLPANFPANGISNVPGILIEAGRAQRAQSASSARAMQRLVVQEQD
jgi:hypothetical protein